MVTPLDFDTA